MNAEEPIDHSLHFPLFVRACVAKGDFKMIVLSVLQQRPMHGYEVTRVIQEQSRGFYRPSAGSVYPALKALLNKGYVRVSDEDRRKVYQITSAGKKLLQTQHSQVESSMRAFRDSFGPERALVMAEMQKTGKLIAMTAKDITPEQAQELSKIFQEAREKIIRIISK
jgi:DNA-binding PadR family transcriptional regulator